MALSPDAPDVVAALKRRLFGLDSPAGLTALERHAQQLHAKYGARGLRYVPPIAMPAAVEIVFRAIGFRPGERLAEIGPGPHGGFAIVAAASGLQVVAVEFDRPFRVDIDALRQQLTGIAGMEDTLTQLQGRTGSLSVNLADSLRNLVEPYRPVIRAAGGTFDIVPGDFGDEAVQARLAARDPFDHVVCLDVITPLGQALDTTTAATTTGDRLRVDAIVGGLIAVARRARTLSIGLVAPEESEGVGEEISRIYAELERGLAAQGRTFRYDRIIGPSSGSVLRCRLYVLNDAGASA